MEPHGHPGPSGPLRRPGGAAPAPRLALGTRRAESRSNYGWSTRRGAAAWVAPRSWLAFGLGSESGQDGYPYRG